MKYSLGLVTLVFFLMGCNGDQSVDSFTHIHGLEYEVNGEGFYIATHHGIILADQANWNLIGGTSEQHDFMGFTILENGNMISSGHPSLQSDLNNPLGVIMSEDKGLTWEPIALHGEVDFHIIHVNAKNQNIIYGLDSYHSQLYKSENGGFNWLPIEISQAPMDIGEIYAITSNPLDANHLLAGFPTGMFSSRDGGETWIELEKEFTVTSFTSVNGHSEEMIAYLMGSKQGLYYSKDFGETWELIHSEFGDEAEVVIEISQHPRNPEQLVVATSMTNIYETHNFGQEWIMIAQEGKRVENKVN
ncbi:F510_1955 family glycosylhydrolase [Halalkalibacter akibai]|uniref:BNR repeat domain protein n=1 Tax=Halalkalibacter akibai (strain ATCC 43226 / DSM 21942 / CIP 109018 / JCM 9157 / 1139) TaxID=1236973 RepID=W4QRY5_HALA3|nr:hypothetical protein [Halalkalibacter akibai]GAE34398.1 BNR repeat domain protein [Halalkalibacter akibai JCM 9157]